MVTTHDTIHNGNGRASATYSPPPPSDLDAEAAVLGAIAVDNAALSLIDSTLSPDHFYLDHNSVLFVAMREMIQAGEPVDGLTLAAHLRERDLLDEVGGIDRILEIMEAVPYAAHVDYYARIVRDKWQKRQIMLRSHRLARITVEGAGESDIRQAMDDLADVVDTAAGDSQRRFTWYSAKQLAEGDFETEYLIPGILAAQTPTLIAGVFKGMKTSVACDAVVSLATGAPFLGKFHVTRPYRVGFMSGETGMKAIRCLCRRIANSKGWSLGEIENMVITADLPHASERADIHLLSRYVKDEGVEVLFLDPAYLAMDLGDDAGNLFAVGKQLRPLSEMVQAAGCTLVLIHHCRKSSAASCEPAELSDVQWSGFAEWAGQWILLSRREKYLADGNGEHKLWMNVGGRPGHSALWAVDITEGRQDSQEGRKWDVEVLPASQARAEAIDAEHEARQEQSERKEQNRRDRDRDTVLQAFAAYPNGETQTQLRQASGLSGQRFGPVFTELLAAERVIQDGEIKKANGKAYAVYRLNGTQRDATGQSHLSRCNDKERDNPL